MEYIRNLRSQNSISNSPGEDSYSDMNCVGSCEQELEVKVITKKCRGVVRKEKVKGTRQGLPYGVTAYTSQDIPQDVWNA